MMARAALPAALFGLGGVLTRYRPEGDMRADRHGHPAVADRASGDRLRAWPTGSSASAPPQLRSAVVTAAMAPGVNAYLFANMYGAARRVAASSVLIATAASVLTVWGWLALLP